MKRVRVTINPSHVLKLIIISILGKWADTNYKLCDRYIPYALGGGYVIGRELVKFVADNSRLLEMYNSEDATMGTWLAGLKVNRKHDTR